MLVLDNNFLSTLSMSALDGLGNLQVTGFTHKKMRKSDNFSIIISLIWNKFDLFHLILNSVKPPTFHFNVHFIVKLLVLLLHRRKSEDNDVILSAHMVITTQIWLCQTYTKYHKSKCAEYSTRNST